MEEPTRRGRLNGLVLLLVVARCSWIFSKPLRVSGLHLGLAQDDFYYYLKGAQSLAWLHQPTVFPHVWTNGFQPLYFLMLALVSVFIHTVPGIFRFLWLLDTLSATAIFLICRRLFLRVSPPLLANALAVLVVAICVIQISGQMEVTLTLPIGCAFLLAGFHEPNKITPRRATAIGALGALLFLSRLDAGILALLWVLATLLNPEYRAVVSPSKVLGLLAGSLPLPLLYFWANLHVFHTLLPVSALAKELRNHSGPSVLLFGTIFGTNEALVDLALGSIVFAIALRKHLSAQEKVLLLAVLLHPFLFFMVEMWISDWPVWPWYFYSLRFAAIGSAIVVCVVTSRNISSFRFLPERVALRGPILPALLLTSGLGKLMLANYNVDSWMQEIERAAAVLNQFGEAHPGVYAMGDRAGMFMITTENPVLQAEGLVMDRNYLEHIRAEDDLRSVLFSYGVNYYVAFVPKGNWKARFNAGCYHATEPYIAGPSTLRMRTDFCGEPLKTFKGFDGSYVIYSIVPR